MKLLPYDGKTSWQIYKTQFSIVAEANVWDPITKARQLAASLRAEAADILRTVPENEQLNFDSLSSALELRFGEKCLKDYSRLQLKTRQQRPNETLQELATDIEKLSHLAFSDCPTEVRETLAVQYFVDGVRDAEIQKALRMAETKDLKAALVYAIKFEAAQQASRRDRHSIRGVEIESDEDPLLKVMTQLSRMTKLLLEGFREIERKSGEEAGKPKKNDARCWKCGGKGHLQRQCQVRQDQQARGLPRNNNQREKLSNGDLEGWRLPEKEKPHFEVLQISSNSGSKNGLFIEANVNGFPCRMVVDTGANVTILRQDFAQQLGGKTLWTPPYVTLQTVKGDKIPIFGKMHIKIQFGNVLYDHIVFVAEITDIFILGLDFLQKHNFVIDLKNNVLHSNSEDVTLFQLGTAEIESCHRIISKSDITIPARIEMLVEGATEQNQNFRHGLTEFPDAENFPKGVLVASTLVDLSKKYVPVRVANITDRPKLIKKGEVLATCAAVTCVEKCSKLGSKEPFENLRIELLKNTELNNEQEYEAKTVLEEFKDLFSCTSDDFGRTTLAQHRIDTGDHTPIKQHPRRLPFAKVEEVKYLLQDMQEKDVIEPSASPWASPIVLVRKKDGSTRFCVDYRRLNAITKKDSYPLPRIDDTLDTLTGNVWFSTLDLKSGYWQVEMDPQDREKTAFTTGGQGLWQFKVMPFGLCNAPATFERLMETVLRGLSPEACLVYLDDIIIVGRNFEEHLENLRKVFGKLKEAKLKLNPSKCLLFRREVSYLGHIISASGVRTDPKKVLAVKEWNRPKDVHQLRSFLGLCTYYRRFVKGFSLIARPLHRLTESKQKFLWSDECEQAFNNLKETLTSAPILAYPDPEKQFILDTDASNESVGAVLSQEFDGQERVIAYWSKCLSKPERNYCVTRKELLAIVKAVENFHSYLYGRKFLLRTDHASLTWLLNFKNSEGQIARWIQKLQEYDFEIKHRKGSLHGNADALSRRPCFQGCRFCSAAEGKYEKDQISPIIRQTKNSSSAPTGPWSDKEVRESQIKDPDIKPIIEFKESSSTRPNWQDISSFSSNTKHYWALWNSLHLRNGVLYRKWESEDGKTSRWQLVLPRSRISDVLKELHSSPTGGHFGVMKTIQKVRERFFWNKIRDDVEKWCKNCDLCGARKGPKRRSRGKLQLYNVGAPFERIAFDILGPLPRTNDCNKYILVIMDYFTKWPEAYPIPDQEAKTVAEVLLENWISRFGTPLQLHSDQGKNFTSAVIKALCELLKIDKTQTTPLHPQSDGMVERFNRTILNHLSLHVSKNQQDWDRKLPLFLLAYRSAVHETTGFTPAQMLFGREIRLPCDLLFGRPPDAPSSPVDYVKDLQERLEDVHEFARSRIKIATEKMKTRYDTRTTGHEFQQGDQVWFWNPIRRKGLSPKLQSSWEGPYSVLKMLNDVVVRIQKSPNSRPRIVHYDRLAPYYGNTQGRH